jgi:hypothetical protein
MPGLMRVLMECVFRTAGCAVMSEALTEAMAGAMAGVSAGALADALI